MKKSFASIFFTVLAAFSFFFFVKATPILAADNMICCACDPDCVPGDAGNKEIKSSGDEKKDAVACKQACSPKKAGPNCDKNNPVLTIAAMSCSEYMPSKESAGQAAVTAKCECSCNYKDAQGNTTQSQLSGTGAVTVSSYDAAVIACRSSCSGTALDGTTYDSSTPTCNPPAISCTCAKGKPPAKSFDQKSCKAACNDAAIAAADLKSVDFVLPQGDFPAIFGRIIKALLGVCGSVAFAMFVYGGFLYLTSGGAPETITKAKNIVIWAVLGLVIIFTSYALVSTIFNASSSAVGVQMAKPVSNQ